MKIALEYIAATVIDNLPGIIFLACAFLALGTKRILRDESSEE